MIPRAASVVTRRRALASISGSAAAAAVPRVGQQQRQGRQQHQQSRGLLVQPAALALPPTPTLRPSFDAPRTSLVQPHVQPPTSSTLPRASTAATTTTAPLAVASPLSLLAGTRRGLVTQARPPAQQSMGQQSSSAAQPPAHLRGRLRPQQLQQRRGFWSPRFMRQIGMPWVVQIFYGTLLMIGVGVLAVSLFATSFVFGFLFLLAFAGFRLFSQRPQLMRQVLRRPAQSPAGAFLRPLMDMLNEGVLLDGLKNARGPIERDVLACLNRHPKLRAFGTDFKSTGLTNMSLETLSINGVQRQHVVMEMLVVSSKPREMFVRVAASHHEGPLRGEGDDRWEYESVQARTPDGIVVDLTKEVTRGGKSKNIVIDVPPRNVRDGDGDGRG